VKRLWNPRLGETARAAFEFRHSNVVSQGQSIIVKGGAYTLLREGLRLSELQSGILVPLSIIFLVGNELRAELGAALQADLAYRLSVGASAPQVEPVSQSWQLETSDGGVMPTGHSGAVSASAQPLVAVFAVRAEASRSPPISKVEVSLQLSLSGTAPTVMRLVAPPTFTFTDSCLISGGVGSLITSCAPGAPLAGRATALLTCSGIAAAAVRTIAGVKVQVMTPEATPAVRSWFVEGSSAAGVQVGWGEDSLGFDVVQMRDVTLRYGAVSLGQSQFAVGFRTSTTVDTGGRLELRKPDSYLIDCSPAAMATISLPIVGRCENSTSSVSILLNGTLAPGEHAFTMKVFTPESTPSPNVFSLLVYNNDNEVQDAAMSMAGQAIHSGLSLLATPISWTSSEAGQTSTVTIGFEVVAAVAAGSLGAVLITLPENFAHAIEVASSVVSVNSGLNLQQGSWADISMVDRLVLILDETRAVAPGKYEFRFPITVPEQIPAYNVWLVTFCQYSSVPCIHSHGADALVTFPIAGFGIGDVSPGAMGQQFGAAVHTAASDAMRSVHALHFIGIVKPELQ